MVQKIIKVGNSAAITIPKEFLKKSGFAIGDELIVEADIAARMLLIKSKTPDQKMSLTPEFFTWLSDISRKYEDTIEELARR